MDAHTLALRFARWHEDPAPVEMSNRRTVFVMVNGRRLPIKQIDEVFDDAFNKREEVTYVPLACGSVVDSAPDVRVADGVAYAARAVMTCPKCHRLITPGTGVQVEGVWYDASCARDELALHAEKRALDLAYRHSTLAAAQGKVALLGAQVKGVRVRSLAVRAQIAKIEADTRVQDTKLEILEKREAANTKLVEAQAITALETAALARERLYYDAVQAERAYDSAHRKEEAEALERNMRFKLVESQIKSEDQKRAESAVRTAMDVEKHIASVTNSRVRPRLP